MNTISLTRTSTLFTTSTVTTGTTTVISTSVATQTPAPPAVLCQDTANPYMIDGKVYTTMCGKNIADNLLVREVYFDTFSECIDFCSATTRCVSGIWVSPTSQYSDKLECILYSAYSPSDVVNDFTDAFVLNV